MKKMLITLFIAIILFIITSAMIVRKTSREASITVKETDPKVVQVNDIKNNIEKKKEDINNAINETNETENKDIPIVIDEKEKNIVNNNQNNLENKNSNKNTELTNSSDNFDSSNNKVQEKFQEEKEEKEVNLEADPEYIKLKSIAIFNSYESCNTKSNDLVLKYAIEQNENFRNTSCSSVAYNGELLGYSLIIFFRDGTTEYFK